MSRRHQSILNVLSAPYSNEYSFRFDGVDEYVDLGTGYDYFDFETGSYTVSFWTKWTYKAFFDFILSFCANNYKFLMIADNVSDIGSLGYMAYEGSQIRAQKFDFVATGINVSDGNWHHVCVVIERNPSNTNAPIHTIYVDTVSTGTSGGTFISPPNYNAIGGGTSGRYFGGSVDEVSIFDSALSSAAVTEIYNSGVPNNLNTLSNASAPVVWFRMGENATFSNPGGVGNWTLLDQGTGSNNNGTSANMEESDRQQNVPT